jgi:hypothetical protein
MAHGYLGDGYGTHGEIDPDRGDDRDRRWREANRHERSDWRDRDRGMMFSDRGPEGRDDRWSDRGWSEGRHGRERDDGAFGAYRDRPEGRRSYSSNPDDHYRSWRDRHMSEVDRDYEDYCREREQQFHRDFDEWRRNRRPASEGRNAEIAQETELELTHERALGGEGNTPSPVGEATLGTNNSENTTIGRARPRR